MNKLTQHKKIVDMCYDGQYHCQNEFRERFIFSPHKRRNEIAGKKRESDIATGKFDFVKRKCEHGVPGQYDYKMILNPNYVPEVEKTGEERVKELAQLGIF
jgi:hypothetical protein